MLHGPRVGGPPTALTDSPEDAEPAASANGRLVAFSGQALGSVGGRAIFVVGIDGDGLRQVTAGVDYDTSPSFSPDGRTIVFTRGIASGQHRLHIWAVGVDGSGSAAADYGTHNESEPVFTPNGKRILYAGDADHDAKSDHADIWAMAADGSDQRVLIDGVRNENSPDVSPDGRQVVFSSNRSHGPNIFIAKSNGRSVRAVTHSKGDCFRGRCYLDPVFAPDGKHLLATSGGRYSHDLDVMRPDGSNRKEIDGGGTEEEGYGTSVGAPAWAPVPR